MFRKKYKTLLARGYEVHVYVGFYEDGGGIKSRKIPDYIIKLKEGI